MVDWRITDQSSIWEMYCGSQMQPLPYNKPLLHIHRAIKSPTLSWLEAACPAMPRLLYCHLHTADCPRIIRRLSWILTPTWVSPGCCRTPLINSAFLSGIQLLHHNPPAMTQRVRTDQRKYSKVSCQPLQIYLVDKWS